MKNQNIQNRTHGSETQHLENEVVIIKHNKPKPQANFNTQTSERSKTHKYQTHLTKDFQNQQQANIRTMKKHIVTNQHEIG